MKNILFVFGKRSDIVMKNCPLYKFLLISIIYVVVLMIPLFRSLFTIFHTFSFVNKLF